MTLDKLIEKLQEIRQINGNAEVYFRHPSHDYWRTQLAGEIEDVEIGYIKWSDYHDQYKVVSPDRVVDAEEGELEEVIIIS